MPHPLSNDLRERVVAHVEAGHSCYHAAERFGTSVSFVVNLMRLWRQTGRVDPRPRGGFPAWQACAPPGLHSRCCGGPR